MNLIFRLILQLIRCRFRPRQPLMEVVSLPLRVLPTDLDINLHLTNSRYLALMDLGRIEFMLRTGLMRGALRRRWLPVVAIASVKFRREINPFQRFTLHTRLLGWDEKWFYMEQRFETELGVAAIGVVKGLFRGPSGNVPTHELVALVGHEGVLEKSVLLAAIDAFDRHLKEACALD